MHREKRGEKELAELLALARARTPNDMRVAQAAVKDAFRLANKLRLRIPLDEKRKLCKKCFTYLKPGITSKHRIAKGRIIITCKNCKNVKRLQYKR